MTNTFTEAEVEYLNDQTLGRIATVGGDGKPHVTPVGGSSTIPRTRPSRSAATPTWPRARSSATPKAGRTSRSSSMTWRTSIRGRRAGSRSGDGLRRTPKEEKRSAGAWATATRSTPHGSVSARGASRPGASTAVRSHHPGAKCRGRGRRGRAASFGLPQDLPSRLRIS